MDGGDKRVERLVGADVGGGFLAADMLLARRQRQHKATPSSRVRRLSCEPPWHLPNEFFARCDYPDVRAAITRRNAKGLSFHRDDIRLHGRAHDAERNWLP